MGVFDTTLLKSNVRGLRYAIIAVTGAMLLLLLVCYVVQLFRNSQSLGEGVGRASSVCMTTFIGICTFMSILVAAFGVSRDHLIAIFVFFLVTMSCLCNASFMHFKDDSRSSAKSLFNALGSALIMLVILILAKNENGAGNNGNLVQSVLAVPLITGTIAAATCAVADAI